MNHHNIEWINEIFDILGAIKKIYIIKLLQFQVSLVIKFDKK